MDVAFFFNSSPDFSNHYFFFPPIFGNAIATIAKKKVLFPYFGNGIAIIRVSQNFFFSFHFGYSTHTSHTRAVKLGRRISVSTLLKFNIFSLPAFSSSFSYFLLNFGNGDTEIRSLSSQSQITFNSFYNAN